MKWPTFPGDGADLVLGYRAIGECAGISHSAAWSALNMRSLVPVYRALFGRAGAKWCIAITKTDAERLRGLWKGGRR